jgi:hypothetical protein
MSIVTRQDRLATTERVTDICARLGQIEYSLACADHSSPWDEEALLDERDELHCELTACNADLAELPF